MMNRNCYLKLSLKTIRVSQRRKQEEIVYTLRINGNRFRPKVFREGKYTIKVSYPDKNMEKVLKEVASAGKDSDEQIFIEF